MIEIVPATEAHARAMAPNLRPGDRAEVEAVGLDPETALLDGVRRSLTAWTALVDGEPAAMWGVTATSITSEVAHPWLLTTPLALGHKKRLLREGQRAVAEMHAAHPVLANLVDSRYPQAHRLLRHLGFTVAEHETLPHLRLFQMRV